MKTSQARKALTVLAALGGAALTVPIAAQTPAPVVYDREIFSYAERGRPDPFRSLLQDGELGIRVEDLTLRVVQYNASDPTQSDAVLAQRGTERRIQARFGERIGSLRILAIRPEEIDIAIEELGVSRREPLAIARPRPAGATTAAPAARAGAQ
jgi:hypothetical protein